MKARVEAQGTKTYVMAQICCLGDPLPAAAKHAIPATC